MYLVTGGAGFIGSSIAIELAQAGHQVRVLDSGRSGDFARLAGVEGVEVIEGDVRSQKAVSAAMMGVEAVFHQAAVVEVPYSIQHPVETIEVNVGGTAVLLEEARLAGVRRFVFASSCAVYGSGGWPEKSERDRPRPLSPYAVSKLCGEQLVAMYSQDGGMDTVSLRYFNVYGPGQRPGSAYAAVVPAFIQAAMKGQALIVHGSGEQTRDFVFIRDVVKANLLAMRVEASLDGQPLNVGTGRAVSINELAIHLMRRFDHIHFERRPGRQGDPQNSQATTSRLQALLRWAPTTPLEEGLEKTAKYLESLRPPLLT